MIQINLTYESKPPHFVAEQFPASSKRQTQFYEKEKDFHVRHLDSAVRAYGCMLSVVARRCAATLASGHVRPTEWRRP